MSTATDQRLQRDNDELAARRFADQTLSMLSDFIPNDCRRRAWDALMTAAIEHGFELTSSAMRKEYEAWKRTQIDQIKLGGS